MDNLSNMHMTKKSKNRDSDSSASGDVKIPKHLYGAGQILRIRRRGAVFDVAQQQSVVTAGVLTFKLSDVLGYSDFTNTFDLYRVDFVEISFRPGATVNNFSNVNTTAPLLYTAIDPSGRASSPTINQIEEYSTLRVVNFNQQLTRRFRPRGKLESNSVSMVPQMALAPRDAWVDSDTPDLTYHSLLYAVTAGQATQGYLQNWQVIVTYYLAFKIGR